MLLAQIRTSPGSSNAGVSNPQAMNWCWKCKTDAALSEVPGKGGDFLMAGQEGQRTVLGLESAGKCFEYKPLIELLRWSHSSNFGKHPILAHGKKSKVQIPCLPLDAKTR